MGLNYTLCVYDGLKIVFKYKKEGHSNTRKFYGYGQIFG